MDSRLEEIARKQNISKGQALKKALALLSMAERESQQGNFLGFVRQKPNAAEGDFEVVGRVSGL